MGRRKNHLDCAFHHYVEVSGNASPGETTFNLEVVNSQGNELQPNDYNVEITASVETDGAGDYNGNLTITGTASAILRMFDKDVMNTDIYMLSRRV